MGRASSSSTPRSTRCGASASSFPLLLMAPLEGMVLGWGAISVSAVALLCGWLLVEIHQALGTDSVHLFLYSGQRLRAAEHPDRILVLRLLHDGRLGDRAVQRPAHALPAFVLDAMLLASVLVLRRRRLIAWSGTPLAFEDQLPVEASPLRLSPDSGGLRDFYLPSDAAGNKTDPP